MNQLAKRDPRLAAIQENIMEDKKYHLALAQVVPKGVDPTRIKRSIYNAVQQNPQLMNCNINSLMKAGMTAAILGLEVDGVTGQGYIMPFKDTATFVPGYKGYITLAQQAGFIVDADVVRTGDKFSYTRGLNPTMEHEPSREPAKGREITHAYAVARSHKYPAIFIVLDRGELDEIRASSAAVRFNKKDSPWFHKPTVMYKKTAIRALASRLPLQVQRAAALETQYEEKDDPAYIDADGQVKTVNGVVDVEKPKYTNDQPQTLIGMEDDDDDCPIGR